MTVKSGIYTITNIETGMLYVGKALNYIVRWNKHKYNLRNNHRKNRYLQNAWNKYGESAFEFSVIEYVSGDGITKEELNNLLNAAEKKWIAYYRTITTLYNDTEGGDGALGRYWTEQQKQEQSMKVRGTKRSDAMREKMRAIGKNRDLSYLRTDEVREKISTALKQTYNIKNAVAVHAEKSKKTYTVCSPSGALITFTGLKDFCREHGLSPSGMVNMFKGRSKSHKGYTLPPA